MSRRRLYVLSPVDVFGRPFGGSLDIRERLLWALPRFDTLIVFCPGEAASVKRVMLGGRSIMVVYGPKRVNPAVALLGSLAMARKPVFRLSARRLQQEDAVFLIEGFLAVCMLPQLFGPGLGRRRVKMRVHNDEAVFHSDRAATEDSVWLGALLRFEACRLWLLERAFHRVALVDRCYIAQAEARRFGNGRTQTVVPYLPAPAPSSDTSPRRRAIVSVANFGLTDNVRSVEDFIRHYMEPLRKRGYTLELGGFGSERLRERHGSTEGLRILGTLNTADEKSLYAGASCCLVASNNRAGYKTRISTALAHGLVPLLHGRGAEANAEDAMLAAPSSNLMRMIDDGSLERLQLALAQGDYAERVATGRSNYLDFLTRRTHVPTA